MSYRSRNNGYGVIIAIVVVLLVGGCGACATSYYKDGTATLTVTGKESVNTDEGHEYRIYTEDETYVMKDSLLKGRFRTSNDYAKIKDGRTYECTKFGWRVPFFSLFENIRDCKEVPLRR